MRRSFHLILITFLIAVVGLSACDDEETFGAAGAAGFDVSADTLSFDTVLTDRPTRTRRFLLYNHSSEGLSIDDVTFVGGQSNGFRVDVDGIFIGDGLPQTIDLRGRDSMYVFIEFTPKPGDADDPYEVTAQLMFHLVGGVQRAVTLKADCQDVISLSSDVLMADTELNARRPYVVRDSLVVGAGATLTLRPGVRLYFAPTAFMRVEGRVLAEGTRDAMVQLRGDRTEYMFVDQPYDRMPDQWRGIVIAPESRGNVFSWCDIHSAHDGLVMEASDAQDEAIRMENSIVHNMGGDCVRLVGAKATFGNCQISNAANCPMNVFGGHLELTHCSLLQFYPFDALRGPALSFQTHWNDGEIPLEQLLLRNCMVTGYSEDEIMGYPPNEALGIAFNYTFSHSLVNTVGVDDDENFIDCVVDNDKETRREKNFPPFNLAALLYRFVPLETSRAHCAAAASVASDTYPEDLRGVVRLADGNADAGCYECQPIEQQ